MCDKSIMGTILIALICLPLVWCSQDILKDFKPGEPEPMCQSDGQFLLHGTNRCKYVRCAYGSQQADGTQRLYAVQSDCPYGTAVSRATYVEHNMAGLNKRRLCTDRVVRHQNGYRLHDPCSVEIPAYPAYRAYPSNYVAPVKTAKAVPATEYRYPVQYGGQYGIYPSAPQPHPRGYPAPYPVYPRPYGHAFPAYPAFPAGFHGYGPYPAQEKQTEEEEEEEEQGEEVKGEEKGEEAPEGKQADLPAEVGKEPMEGEQETVGEEGERIGQESAESTESTENEVEGEVEKVIESKEYPEEQKEQEEQEEQEEQGGESEEQGGESEEEGSE